MSRTISSKKASSLPPPPTPSTIANSCSKRRQSPRSPLQDLNRISSSSNSSDASSCVSTEVPKGCLRFLASSSFRTPAHRPKSLSKTPNSVPHELALKQSRSKSSKENLPKGNAGLQTKTLRKNPPCLYQWQSGKKSGSRTGQKSKTCSGLNEFGENLSALPSTPKELKRKEDGLGGGKDIVSEPAHLKSGHSDANATPKKVAGSYLDITVYEDVEDNLNKSTSKTPPIHNSVSPEIQCGSSLVLTPPPACYGAGYIVSGVTDKRKCRPRGILTVEENCSGSVKMGTNSIGDDDDDEKTTENIAKKDSPSLLPLPTEALVHWISSPQRKVEKILNPKSEIELSQSPALAESTTIGSCTTPSSSSKNFWNASDSSDLSSAANGIRREMSSSISPVRLSEFQLPYDSILLPSYSSIPVSPNSARAGSSVNIIDDNSPFSLNSVGSGNVIQTPQSDSSSDLHVGLSLAHADNQKEDDSNPDHNSPSEVLLAETFLFNSSAPLEDSVNSSFQFDCLTMPYEVIDLSKLPVFLDDQDPWLSSSTIDNGSQSQMRISWREGLMSQVNELDEFDSCRCLSDEEEIANDCDGRLSGSHVNVEIDNAKKLNYDKELAKTEDSKVESDGLGKEMFPDSVSCSGAESISTDGGGLVASRDDSDWTLCIIVSCDLFSFTEEIIFSLLRRHVGNWLH